MEASDDVGIDVVSTAIRKTRQLTMNILPTGVMMLTHPMSRGQSRITCKPIKRRPAAARNAPVMISSLVT